MGNYQGIKGNPEQKMFYIIDQLVGGINTEFSDDTSPDNEFYNIVNFDMNTRGSLYKRLGFGKLNAVSQIFNLFMSIPSTKGKTPEDPNPEVLNDNIVYMKMLKNDNGVFRNLSAFSGDKAYRQYQQLFGMQNNSFKLLMITTSLYTNTSKAWLFTCTLPDLEYDVEGKPTATETIVVDSTVYELPVVFNWDKNLGNIETIEFFDKIYFTSNNKALVTFDRATDTFSYSGTGVTGQTNTAYKPNAMEIRKIGFNLLGDDPLHWVNYQGLSTNSIQGIYITTMDNKPVQIIPNGGKFRLNILYTGTDSGFTIGFKEGDSNLTFTSTVNTTYSGANLKVYDIVINEVPTSEVEIKIEKTGSVLDPFYDYYTVGTVDPETKAVTALNVGEYGIVEMYNRAVYYKDDTIFFSEINNFGYVPNYNYISLPIEPMDKITKVVYFKNVYIIFTKYRIYKMIDQFGTTSFQVMPVNPTVGCHAPNTIVPIENELYFASPRGLYSLRSSAFRDGIEDLKELDTKVKTLTSNVTLYVGEIDDPAIRYNGISEKAYAFRYKDKYMLFFNTAYETGDLAALVNQDVLVYKYDLKAFSLMKFPVKPTFLFMVDNAITTFCTVKEKEDFTEEAPLLAYDFETGTSNSVPDDTGNGFTGTVVNGVLQPGYGIDLDGIDDFAKVGNIESTVNLENGFEIEIEAKPDSLVNNATLFDLGQLIATGSALPSTGSIFTNWSNGYRAELIYSTTPNVAANRSTVSYTLRYHRDSTARNAAHNGTFNLMQGVNTLIANTAFNFNFGGALQVDVHNGSFIVDHDSTGNYSKSWTLNLSSQFPTYSSGVTVGPDTYFDVIQYPSWSTKYGIRMIGRAVGDASGATVYVRPYIHLEQYASLYIGARNAYSWLDGNQTDHTVPAISNNGNTVVDIAANEERAIRFAYSGSKSISVDGRANIKATISGTYRENIDIDGFSFALPTLTPYNITTWNNFSTSGTATITFNQIASPSKREIYMILKSTGAIEVGSNSEFGSGSFLINGVADLAKHKWRVVFTKGVSTYTISVFKDGISVGSGTIPLNVVKNALRDNNLIGKSNGNNALFAGEIYLFNIKLSNGTKVVEYIFEEGRNTTLTDQSGANRNGSITGATWLVENGLKLNGTSSYVSIPEIPSTYQFSNGFTIEIDAKFDNISQISKLIDLATSYDTGASSNGKCSINVGSPLNGDIIKFMSTSIDYKTYELSKLGADLLNRHIWKFSLTDNGSGYLMEIRCDNVVVANSTFNYGGITNIARKSNFIGKSNNPAEGFFKGMIYSLKITLNASSSPVPIYVGALYEYDTTYDDFGRPMDLEIETKGINLKYPMHIKKLKNIFLKGLGGFAYDNFKFYVFADGHLVNNPFKYTTIVDDETGEITYEYEENRELSFNEGVSLLGNMRLDNTALGLSSYETRKLIVPAKGKNFSVRIVGESGDFLGIESFGFVFKLGKVKEK